MSDRQAKILIVSANTFDEPYKVYPLGVSYLCSYLQKWSPQTRVDTYDMNFGSPGELSQRLRKERYDIVGLSLRNIDDNNLFSKNSFVEWYRTLARTVRESCDAVLVLGGAGFSIFPGLLLDELGADYGIKGEGEAALCDLVGCIAENRSPEGIEGLVFRTPEGIKINPRTTFTRNPELSFDPAWLPCYWESSGMLNVQTKRGCPHRCIYCSYPVIEGRKVRTLDVRSVVDSLTALNREHGINYTFFTDSVFNIDRGYNCELAEGIIRSGIKMNWGAYFSPRELDRQELELYKRAGLTHIEFGTDSFSDSQLKNYRKDFTWEEVLSASRACDALGIFYAHFMILGGYGETEESLDETFARSAGLTNTVIFPYIGMRIYPETELFGIALREGVVKNESELLEPVYYVSPQIEVAGLKRRAAATGAKWIFPEDGQNGLTDRFRAKKCRGPLWEYLRY